MEAVNPQHVSDKLNVGNGRHESLEETPWKSKHVDSVDPFFSTFFKIILKLNEGL